jgi:hypothetical protein
MRFETPIGNEADRLVLCHHIEQQQLGHVVVEPIGMGAKRLLTFFLRTVMVRNCTVGSLARIVGSVTAKASRSPLLTSADLSSFLSERPAAGIALGLGGSAALPGHRG